MSLTRINYAVNIPYSFWYLSNCLLTMRTNGAAHLDTHLLCAQSDIIIIELPLDGI